MKQNKLSPINQKNSDVFKTLDSDAKKLLKIKTDPKKVKHLKNKKWFEIEDLHKIWKDCHVFFVKGKKNIGKTYSIIQTALKVIKKNKKFILARNTLNEIESLAQMWNADITIPFYIDNKQQIYLKPEQHQRVSLRNLKVVGSCVYLNSPMKYRSLQYNDYEFIFYDEYVASDISRIDTNSFVRNVILFFNDVQRAKPSLNIYCFGNNHNTYDLFSTYFQIANDDAIWEYTLNPNQANQMKLVFANFKDFYKGTENVNSVASALAVFDKQLDAFINENASNSTTRSMVEYSLLSEGKINYFLYLDGFYYVCVSPKNKVPWPKFSNKCVITKCDIRDLKSHIKTITLELEDSLKCDTFNVFYDDINRSLFLFNLYNLYLSNRLEFTNPETKDLFIEMFNRYQHEINNLWDSQI